MLQGDAPAGAPKGFPIALWKPSAPLRMLQVCYVSFLVCVLLVVEKLPYPFAGGRIVRLILFVFASASSTHTVTMSPTRTTSLG